MAKIITRGETNAMIEGTYETDLNKLVLYNDTEIGGRKFTVSPVNSVTKARYKDNQTILSDDINITPPSLILRGSDVEYYVTSSTLTIFAVNVDNIGWDSSSSSQSIIECIVGENSVYVSFPENLSTSQIEYSVCITGRTITQETISKTGTFKQKPIEIITFSLSSVNNPVGATATTNTINIVAPNISNLGFYERGSTHGCGLSLSNITQTSAIASFNKNSHSSSINITVAMSGTTNIGETVTASTEFTQTSEQFWFEYTGVTMLSPQSGRTSEFDIDLFGKTLVSVSSSTDGSCSTGGTLTAPTLTFTYPGNTSGNIKEYMIIMTVEKIGDSRHISKSVTISQQSFLT